jgi:diguanylate cyclase (GGDEF)-like protein/PAS domain S-box-containing protein
MPQTPDAVPSEPARGGGAILLIEDNRGDAVLIEAMLAEVNEADRPMIHVSRLEDGLESLARNEVDVILADLSLPDSVGLETFTTLHQRAPQLPIIVLTGSRDRSLALRAIQEGAQDYLVKDEVNGPALIKAINYAIERKQAETRLRESENRYKGLVNSVPDAILLLKDGRIVDCNSRAMTLFGYDREQLHGLTLGPLSPSRQPDGTVSVEAFHDHITAARTGGAQWFEWQFQRIDKRPVATEVILEMIELEGERQVLAIVRDLTERKQAEQRIRFQASLLNQVHNAVLATDRDDKIIFWNRHARQLYGWDAPEVMGRPATDLIVPAEEQELIEQIRGVLAEGQNWEGELELKRKDGSTFPALFTLSAVHDENDEVTGFVGVASDISERKEAEKKLEFSAFHDALTGLPNRVLFADRLARAIARGSREGGRYAVLVMDLDRFKVINDSLGHLVGDELLIQFSRRVESCLRPGDTLARLGGDEFTILLENVQHTSDAVRVAERIHEKMSEPFLLGTHEVFSSTSIGITFGTANYQEPAHALRDADIAMYRAKSQGKGCHVIFETGMHDRAVSQLTRETRLRRALDREEFGVHYQPILDLESGQCVACEALLRWKDPAEADFGTQEFISIAEETGLIIPIGQKVLDDVCQHLEQWQRSMPLVEDFTVHVNLSTKQFCHRGLVNQINDALVRHKLHGRKLTLEITEGVLMEHPVLAAAMLGDLREMDVHVCVDDFGTGYSSLSYLHQFPVDVIKIDRSFTHGLGQSITSSAIVEAIVGLGHNLGMQTIAEGVESEQHRQQLIQLGCRYAQGFLFNPALDPATMSAYLGSTTSQISRH